jgi:hypothetical protein
MAIASEQGRVYRACINGQISTSDGARLTYQLKELRCTREAINAEIAAAAAKAPAIPAKIDVSIISIPTNHFLSAEQSAQISNGEFLKQIEHERIPLSDYTRDAAAQAAADREINAAIEAAAIVPPDAPAPREAPQSPEEENQVINNLKAEINELSRKMGIDLVV